MSDPYRYERPTPEPVLCGVCGSPIDMVFVDFAYERRSWVEPCGHAFPSPADPNPFPRLHLFRRTRKERTS